MYLANVNQKETDSEILLSDKIDIITKNVIIVSWEKPLTQGI